MCPTSALASRTSRRVMPPKLMIVPARRNRGAASKGKESAPATILWPTTKRGKPASMM